MSDYHTGDLGPTLVGYNLTESAYLYMMRILALGALEGPIGDQKPNQDLAKVMHAMHTVLSGGSVEIEVTDRGNPDIANELNGRLAQSVEDANAINKKAAYYVTVVP